jgi:hypothetical protein
MALSSVALVALLGLTACNEKDEKDTGSSDTAVGSDTSVSALYGVPNTEFNDADGDGSSPEMGDCNEDDQTISPVASETKEDGVDSNCDGDDDT